jgi:hypothetical protein
MTASGVPPVSRFRVRSVFVATAAGLRRKPLNPGPVARAGGQGFTVRTDRIPARSCFGPSASRHGIHSESHGPTQRESEPDRKCRLAT